MEGESNIERWRLILGKGADPESSVPLEEEEAQVDEALDFLYGDQKTSGERKILISDWLKDIEKFFPEPAIIVLQKEAIEQLKLKDLLNSPELLASIQPDKNLILNLIEAKDLIPPETKDEVRKLVRKYIEKISEKYFLNLLERTRGVLKTVQKSYNPRPRDIDWKGTIRMNMRNYLPEHKTIVPARLVGSSRNSVRPKHLFVLVDQSYSMAHSVMYAGIASSILASLPLLKTRLIAFDTEMVELTEMLTDPVDLLFGIQLGGGTHIAPVVEYVEKEIEDAENTYILMITDLYEGFSEEMMLQTFEKLVHRGVKVAVLLTFEEKGIADYDKKMGKALAGMGISVIGCSTELFPEMIEVFFRNGDVLEWAGKQRMFRVG